jgi:hypothetical protein
MLSVKGAYPLELNDTISLSTFLAANLWLQKRQCYGFSDIKCRMQCGFKHKLAILTGYGLSRRHSVLFSENSTDVLGSF